MLDDRKYTNDVQNPDQLKVYTTIGSGDYTLHEEQNGKCIDTIFVSELVEEGVQRVTFSCNAQAVENMQSRRYKFVLCNILSGEVTVHADGVVYPAFIDDNGRLSVIMEEVVPDVRYEICVHFAKQANEKRTEAIRKTITRLQMDNNEKNGLFEKLCKSDKATYENIVNQISVPQIAKNRLREIVIESDRRDM